MGSPRSLAVHFVYIVRCSDGTLYTGYTRDPVSRERAHNSGRGAKYTAGRRPVRLVYQEAFRSVGKALAREYVVKQLTRAQKHALIVWCRAGACPSPKVDRHRCSGGRPVTVALFLPF